MHYVFQMYDVHHPDVNPHFWSAALRMLHYVQELCARNKWQLSVVLGGDFGEWTSGNSHTPLAFRAAYEADCDANRRALSQVRTMAPTANIFLMEGNHENMVLRLINQFLPTMAAGFWERWARDLELDKLDVVWVPTAKQPLKIGRLRMLHGDQMGKFLPKHRAMAAAQRWGFPGGVIVFGHGHTPQSFVQPGAEGDCVAYAAGCGRTLDPEWMKGAPAGWANELHLAIVHENGAVANTPVQFINGCLAWGGHIFR